MADPNLVFNPVNGWNDTEVMKTNPANQAETREQFQRLFTQIQDFENNTMVPYVKELDGENIKKTTDQSIDGVKTFTSSPIVPTPATDMQTSTKKYVDDMGTSKTNDLNTHKTSSDHDGRYYTETETDGLLNQKVTQGTNFTGTWQGFSPTQTSPGIQAVVDSHTSQLADIVQQPVETGKYDYANEAIVTFQWDDGTAENYTVAKPIFDSENVPASIAMVTSQIGNWLTLAQLNEFKNKGWSIVSHTNTHVSLAEQTEAVIDSELKTSRDILKANGFDYDYFVTPYGSTNATVRKYLRKYYRCAVHINSGSINTSPINNYQILRKYGLSEAPASVTLAQCKANVDEAIANGTWLIFEEHPQYPAWSNQSRIDEMHELIQYIKSKNIKIVNLVDGFKLKGNIVDINSDLDTTDYFQVGRNGKVKSSIPSNLKIYNTYYDRTIDNTTPLTSFAFGVSATYFTNANITGKGFPNSDNGGVLETFRIPYNINNTDTTADPGGHQFFKCYQNNQVYKRRWNNSTKLWDAWELFALQSDTNTKNINAYTSAQLITAYPSNKLTTFPFNSSNSTGFPCTAGIVTTYRVNGNGWDRQEVREYNSNAVWSRYTSTSDGSWTAWVKISVV